PENELRLRNLRMLAMLAGVVLLPFAVAFWMYYGTDWGPAARVTHVELIIPARPLPHAHLTADSGTEPPALFRGKWSLVYIGNGQCDDTCRKSLYLMRQTRLSLNNEMHRVERVFLVTSDCCAREFLSREHPGLLVLNATDTSAEPLLRVFPPQLRDQ